MTTTPANSIDRVDPMPAAALGMWLFLAGEAMFFAGLLTAYIVLQSVPGERALFLRSARVVSLPLTITAGALLTMMAAAVARRMDGRLMAGLAAMLLLVQGYSYAALLSHRTIVTTNEIYDGTQFGQEIVAARKPLPPALDLSHTMPSDVGRDRSVYPLPGDARANQSYGSSRNNYFACYFLVTGAHAVHVIGGLVAMAWLAARRRAATGVHQQAMALYWQFLNGVGLLSLVLLALG